MFNRCNLGNHLSFLKHLDHSDIHIIAERVKARQEAFDEDLEMSIGVVLMNYGNRYVAVRCIGGEWTGTKGDCPLTSSIPLCPNGHPLIETTRAPILALMRES